MALSAKKSRFVDEYLIDLDSPRAAERAGVARQTARNWLKDPQIKKAIKEGTDAKKFRCEVSADRVLNEMQLVAFSDLFDVMVPDGDTYRLDTSDPEKRRIVSSIKFRIVDGKAVPVEIKPWSKMTALDQLGKHLGLFKADDDQRDVAQVIELRIKGRPVVDPDDDDI